MHSDSACGRGCGINRRGAHVDFVIYGLWLPRQYESPLLRSLKTLHNYLQAFDDLQDVDTVMYLRPFLDVIESQDTR